VRDPARNGRRDAAEVWVIRLAPDYRVGDDQEGWLDTVERDQAASFCTERDRHLYIAAHVWLRRILGAALAARPSELVFTRDAHGKPAVSSASRPASGGTLDFSLSHTADGIACALSSTCRVGVDIEQLAPISRLAAVASYALHPDEMHHLLTAPEHQQLPRFYRFWTAKESLLKAIGSGLEIAPSAFAFTDPERDVSYLSVYPEAKTGRLHSVTYLQHLGTRPEFGPPEHVFAVSALTTGVELIIHEILCPGPRQAAAHVRGYSFSRTIGTPVHAQIH
jgi:4'-phosphopantetheinyl transferase